MSIHTPEDGEFWVITDRKTGEHDIGRVKGGKVYATLGTHEVMGGTVGFWRRIAAAELTADPYGSRGATTLACVTECLRAGVGKPDALKEARAAVSAGKVRLELANNEIDRLRRELREAKEQIGKLSLYAANFSGD